MNTDSTSCLTLIIQALFPKSEFMEISECPDLSFLLFIKSSLFCIIRKSSGTQKGEVSGFYNHLLCYLRSNASVFLLWAQKYPFRKKEMDLSALCPFHVICTSAIPVLRGDRSLFMSKAPCLRRLHLDGFPFSDCFMSVPDAPSKAFLVFCYPVAPEAGLLSINSRQDLFSFPRYSPVFLYLRIYGSWKDQDRTHPFRDFPPS